MSLAPKSAAAIGDLELHCMELWGGRGDVEGYLHRPGLDVWVSSVSSGAVDAGGGAFHLISSCASGRITRMLLVDVCCLPAQFGDVADDLKDLLKKNVNSIQQTRLIRHMGERLECASHRGTFASMLVAGYFAPNRTLTLCNAGHPAPLLLRRGAERWTALAQPLNCTWAAQLPSGVLDPREYQHMQIRLDVGDMALFYSNSLSERCDAQGRTLGSNGMRALLDGIAAGSLRDMARQLSQRLQTGLSAPAPQDDSTFLLCQATDSRVSLRDSLLAPFRLLGSVSDRTQLE